MIDNHIEKLREGYFNIFYFELEKKLKNKSIMLNHEISIFIYKEPDEIVLDSFLASAARKKWLGTRIFRKK